AAARDAGHPACPAIHAKTRQKLACEMAPAMIASDALAAKEGPGSSARKKAIGAEVNGMPTSHPLRAEPHRRPARLAAPITTGVSTSLRARAPAGFNSGVW